MHLKTLTINVFLDIIGLNKENHVTKTPDKNVRLVYVVAYLVVEEI